MPHDGLQASTFARRLALATWLSAFPLVVLGATVTTLRQGMVIQGWIVGLDGEHFLLAYPLEKWFSDTGHFAEHTHRLFGALVGLLSIAYVVAAHRARLSRAHVAWAWTGLLAVCAQGAIGGFRVLENAPKLAFLHGVCAQVVLAVLAVNVVLNQPAWREAKRFEYPRANALRRGSVLSLAAVFAQIFLGAWLRHTGDDWVLAAHIGFAVLATGGVVALARELRESGHAAFAGRARRLVMLVTAQVVLGLLALVAIFVFSGGFTGQVSTAEAITATAHVLFGALLLQASVASVLWTHRGLALRSANVPSDANVRWEAAQ